MDIIVRQAAVRGRKGRWDVGIENGKISEVQERVSGSAELELPANGRLLTPGYVNIHCHLDKCLTGAWADVGAGPNVGSPDVIPRATRVKERFTQDDIVSRASEAVKSSILAGTTAVRAFADVDTVGGLLAVKSLLRVKATFKEAIDLQVVAFPQEGILRDAGTEELLEQALELGADVVGGIPWYESTREASEHHTDFVFDLAKRHGKDVHALIDDTSDPGSKNIEYLLSKTIREGFKGRVAASHCRGALDSPDAAYARRVVGLAKEAGATVVENSHVSLFMYGRTDEHPVRRGVTRVREFLEGGVNVAIGQDDIDDPYYPFGRGDMLELALIMAHAAQLSTPEDLEKAYDMITTNPAKGMRLSGYGMQVGDEADLVLLDSTSVHEALRMQPARLAVIHRGKLVAETKAERKLYL
ncbi:MAG: amidohydrolase family protein [Thaumarchaeota archaeon]|nr:amidohydrolase family protein [Nitrososphaerota archaeon]